MNGLITSVRKRMIDIFGYKKNTELIQENKDLVSTNANLSKTLNDRNRKLEESIRQIKQTFTQLIAIREQLDLVKATQPNNVSKIIDNISREIKNIMISAGIEVVEDVHIKFNESIHSIVDTIETDDETKVDLIAKCVCPGYRHNGDCLKEQKVVIYVQKQEVSNGLFS